MSEETEVVVVGAGQAGVAMSEHLGAHGVPHLVLERHRVAERWRSERWDSLVANGPAWHDRFPGLEFSDVAPDGFAAKDQVAQYFSAYAEKIGAPIRTGVEVTSVRRHVGRPGFRIETSRGGIDARFVVAATGPFQRPVIPPVVPDGAVAAQTHSSGYRNPAQLPPGAVLVVGAGSSGVQIAEELRRSGRRVLLSVGPHDRPPRRYRGRDFCWWLGVLGLWDAETPPRGAAHVTIAVSGARGGHTVDFRALAADGIELLGMTTAYEGRGGGGERGGADGERRLLSRPRPESGVPGRSRRGPHPAPRPPGADVPALERRVARQPRTSPRIEHGRACPSAPVRRLSVLGPQRRVDLVGCQEELTDGPEGVIVELVLVEVGEE
ncbi:Pyridine nucleotide-disulphide oxidoreductase [Streptomyces zhaozhouensis]|uniref:Pyridine nucleotide-disulphide oxidoreductase n=1 Tax=Streptomyces zhaozhouensis TaxID=1300267 RepID=A0A286DVJ7_9ACTN|nr:NAD(P)/FAD-dependent oxidoreductase [Streptomyces zhaozhouensis]SOD62678.1 Pyridine nucleotide-disulphide oxidoreductase [Streptomyces zhaozhouensis]